MRKLIIREIFKGRWEIINAKGDVIMPERWLGTASQAEEYMKAYISSYMNYRYEVKPRRTDERK